MKKQAVDSVTDLRQPMRDAASAALDKTANRLSRTGSR